MGILRGRHRALDVLCCVLLQIALAGLRQAVPPCMEWHVWWRAQHVGHFRVCNCRFLHWHAWCCLCISCHFVWQGQYLMKLKFATVELALPILHSILSAPAWSMSHHALRPTLNTPDFTLYTAHLTRRILNPHATLYTPHFGLCIPHSALHASHSPLPTPRSTLCTLQSPVPSPHFTLHTSHSTLCTALYTLHSALHPLLSTISTWHFTLFAPHATLYTLHLIFHTLHLTHHAQYSTLYAPHLTVYSFQSSFHFTLYPLQYNPFATLLCLYSTLHAPHSAFPLTPHRRTVYTGTATVEKCTKLLEHSLFRKSVFTWLHSCSLVGLAVFFLIFLFFPRCSWFMTLLLLNHH